MVFVFRAVPLLRSVLRQRVKATTATKDDERDSRPEKTGQEGDSGKIVQRTQGDFRDMVQIVTR